MKIDKNNLAADGGDHEATRGDRKLIPPRSVQIIVKSQRKNSANDLE